MPLNLVESAQLEQQAWPVVYTQRPLAVKEIESAFESKLMRFAPPRMIQP
jgi:hypothetical protein